jgi:hypothetical protein
MEDAATPLPSEETTPPVTNIYFGAIRVARFRGEQIRACRTSAGLTYIQLWSEAAKVSMQSLVWKASDNLLEAVRRVQPFGLCGVQVRVEAREGGVPAQKRGMLLE